MVDDAIVWQDPSLYSRELQAALSKAKTSDALKAARLDLLDQCEAMMAAAALGMAELLAGPSIDGDTRLQGSVGTWIHQMVVPSAKAAPYIYGPPCREVHY